MRWVAYRRTTHDSYNCFVSLYPSTIRYLQLMPGGVSSPVRAFKSVGGNPVVFDKVKGAYAWDVDGNKYIDYVGTWGPAILGHADDDVLDAVKKTMDKGELPMQY